MVLKVPFAAVAIFWLASLASAQQVATFVFTGIAGDAQTVTVGHLFPTRFVVRLVDPAGNPLPGAQVNFQNEGCVTFPGIPCEFPGEPGHFASGSDNATMITDASGTAIAPPYYAGLGAGAIGIEVIVLPNIAPYYFGVPQALSNNVEFRLLQVVGQPVSAAPALSYIAMLLLCIICGVAGLLVVGRRSGGS
jgi:hypothetical protein